MKGKTKSGYEVEVADEKFDDMQVLDYLVAVTEGDMTGIAGLIRKLLTPEQKLDFYSHVKRIHGSTGIEPVALEFFELFQSFQDGKN